MKIKIPLLTIIIIASLLRLINLSNFPAGLNADEAALGYNAYSLLQTGKDEYGTPVPTSFKSFGDYKPGLYVYLAMPFILILGLTETAVRLPSALLGIATVFLIYSFSKFIFKNEYIGLIAAFLLAISPWHIHFSRGAWETTVASFFILLGLYLFLKGIKNMTWIFLSGLSFLAAMYTYQSPRLIVPIFVIALLIIYHKSLTGLIKNSKKTRPKTIIFLVLLVIFTIPLILQFSSGGGMARFSGLSFFSDTGSISRLNELRGQHQNPSSLDSILIHNKVITYGISFLGHHIDHFDPDFLFINGDPLIRDKVPETGQFYLIQGLFLLVGIFALIRMRNDYKIILLVWILIAPLASATTYQTPNALRSLNMVLPLTIIMAVGTFYLINGLKIQWKLVGLFIVGLVLLFEVTHYLESYYIHYPKRYPLSWEYGFQDMVGKLNRYESNYQKVVITDRYDQPYILVLFYKKYDPKVYQPQAKLSERDKFNFGTVRGFDKYLFTSINPEVLEKEKPGTLFIGTLEETPKNAKIIDKVYFPNKKEAFVFFEI